jgi:hypothetical protein
MRIMERFAAVLVSAIILTMGPVAGAQTGKKIIVYSFTGKAGAVPRDQLVKALGDAGYNIASRKDAADIAKDMGESSIPTSNSQRAEIAKALSLDGFISGSVTAKGKSRTLSLEVFALCESNIVHTLEYDWVGAKMTPDTVALAVEQIDSELQKAIASCWATPEPAPVVPETQPVVEEQPKKKLALVKGDGGARCKMGGSRCWLPPAVLFRLGFLISMRNLEIDPVDNAMDIRKYRYEGTAYPLFGLDLRLDILRFFKKNPIVSPGLLFSFAHSFLLTSHTLDQGVEPVDLDTKDVRLKFGLGLEIAPKPDTLPLWISLDLGWGMHNFLVERHPTSNRYISDFNYQFVDIGLGLRADVVKRWLDLGIRIGFLAPYTIGDAETFYGKSAEKRFGFNVGVRLGGMLVYGLAWAVGFDYIGYIAKFKGEGTIAPSYPSGKSMKDFYPTGYFLLGYRY